MTTNMVELGLVTESDIDVSITDTGFIQVVIKDEIQFSITDNAIDLIVRAGLKKMRDKAKK